MSAVVIARVSNGDGTEAGTGRGGRGKDGGGKGAPLAHRDKRKLLFFASFISIYFVTFFRTFSEYLSYQLNTRFSFYFNLYLCTWISYYFINQFVMGDVTDQRDKTCGLLW